MNLTLSSLPTMKPDLAQFLRYCAVGVLNTMVTLVVIFVCKSLLGINPWVSNAIGYVAGLINSFIWNRRWVFQSHGRKSHEAVRFAVGFLICYGIQFFFTWFLTEPLDLGQMEWELGPLAVSGYGVATILGMVIYTLCNFIYNRVITFRD